MYFKFVDLVIAATLKLAAAPATRLFEIRRVVAALLEFEIKILYVLATGSNFQTR